MIHQYMRSKWEKIVSPVVNRNVFLQQYLSRRFCSLIAAQLEKQRRLDNQQKRCQSALLRPGQRFAQPTPDITKQETDKPDSAIKRTDFRTLQSTPSRFDKRPATTPANAARLRTLSPIRSQSPEKQAPTPHTAPGWYWLVYSPGSRWNFNLTQRLIYILIITLKISLSVLPEITCLHFFHICLFCELSKFCWIWYNILVQM